MTLSSKGFDYRWLLALVIVLYSSVVLYNIIVWKDYSRTWEGWLNITVAKPGFVDLKNGVLKGSDEFRDKKCSFFGKDRQTILYVYPRLWFLLSYTGISSKHYVIAAIVVILLFFAAIFSLIGKINLFEFLFYSLTLSSFPFLLALERANVDLIIFLLLFLLAYFYKKNHILVSCGIILLATFLKFYPIAAYVIFLNDRKHFKHIIIFSFICLCMYSPLLYSDFINTWGLKEGYLFSYCRSFGLFVYADYLAQVISNIIHSSRTATYTHLAKYFHGAAIILVALIAGCAFLAANRKNKTLQAGGPFIPEFRIGASMYLGTFLLCYNYDYRLIFLLFTIPQIMYWIKNEKQLQIICIITLLSIVVSFNYFYFAFHYESFFTANKILSFPVLLFSFRESALWVMFFAYLYMLIITVKKGKDQAIRL